jgi:hypothetical protein
MIHPTVGRVVWFRPNRAEHVKHFVEHDASEPMDAHVVKVWGPRMVNLVVFDHDGNMHPLTSVDLVQEGDANPVPGRAYCEWMPYQVGQAKKHEAEKAA